MQPLALAPETEIPGQTASPEADKDKSIAVHIDNSVERTQGQNGSNEQDQPWLQLNSDVHVDATANGDNKATEPSRTPGQTDTETKAVSSEKTEDAPPKVYTIKDVSVHNAPNDMWLVIDNEVYDVSEFRHRHPGGAKILSGVAGKDATKKFDKYHRRALLDQYKPSLRVGILDFPEAMTNSKRGFLQKIGIGKGKS